MLGNKAITKMIILNTHTNNFTLTSIEKAAKKIESAISNYNKIAGDCNRTEEVDRTYLAKAVQIYKRLEAQHKINLNN